MGSDNIFDTVEIKKKQILNQLSKGENDIKECSSPQKRRVYINKNINIDEIKIPTNSEEEKKRATQMTLPSIDIKSFETAQKKAHREFKKIEKKGISNSQEEYNLGKKKINKNTEIRKSNINVFDGFTSELNEKKGKGFFKSIVSAEEDDIEEYYEPEILKKRETIDDYNKPEDAASIKKDLAFQLRGAIIKFIICFIIILPLGYFNIVNLTDNQWINDIGLDLVSVINLILIGIIFITQFSVSFCGIGRLFKGKVDYDTLPSLCCISAIINEVIILLIYNDVIQVNQSYKTNLYSYCFIAGLILIFNLFGKLFAIFNVTRNFALFSKDKTKTIGVVSKNDYLNEILTSELIDQNDKIVYTKKADFVTRFLDKSYSVKAVDKGTKLWSYIGLISVFICTIFYYFNSKDIFRTVNIFTAMLCIVTPFSSAAAVWVPFSKFSGKLRKKKVIMLSNKAVNDFKDVNAVVLNDTDLFSNKNITISGIKVFGDTPIDYMLTTLASIFTYKDTILSSVFLKILDGNEKMLKKITSYKFIKSSGIAAVINKEKIICGNKKMMEDIGITLPKEDYEKMSRPGRYVLYVAVDFEIKGVFAVNYTINKQSMNLLHMMEKRQICGIINTNDPNFSQEFINEIFDVDVPVQINNNIQNDFIEKSSKPSDRISSDLVSLDGARGIAYAIANMNRISTNISMCVIIKILSMIFGIIFAYIISFGGLLTIASPIAVIIFQTIWTLPIVIISLFYK